MDILDGKLRIFQLAAELKNFSETAAALGMSQPNVTQQIARLEQTIGMALFDRTGRKLELTPAGEALAAECGALAAETAEIERRMRNAAGSIRHYRIGGTMTAGGYVLPDCAAQYMRANPRHRLSIHIHNTAEIAALLKARALDVALVEGPFDRDFFWSEPFVEDELIAVAAPGRLPERFSLAEYRANGGALIMREPGSGTRYHFERFLNRTGQAPLGEDEAYVVNSFDAVKQLVRGGFGITVISELAVRDELKSGVLQASCFTEGRLRRKMNFIYLANDNLRFAERFIAFCRSAFPAVSGTEPPAAGCRFSSFTSPEKEP